jgi:ABC-type multidrug transport system fused ATPase/permease subunit
MRPLGALFDRNAVAFFAGYYRERWGRLLGFALVASAQSLLFIPILLLIRRAFDVTIPQGDVRGLVIIGVEIFLLRVAGSAIQLALRSSILRTIKGAVTDLRRDLVSRLYALSSGHFARADLDHAQTRIVQDTERVDVLSNALLSGMLPACFTSVALLAYLLYLDWQLVLLTAAAVPLLWIATRVSAWIVKRDVHAFQRAFEQFSKGVRFVLQHMELTRATAYEREEIARQHGTVEHLRATGHRMAMSFAVHRQVQRTITGLVGLLILVAGGAAVARGMMTVGEFLSFTFAAGLLNGQLDTVISGVPDLIAGNESLVTLRSLMTEGELEPYRGSRHVALDGRIELRDVTFAYDEHVVLRNVSLALAPRASVAIVGPNGAGKTTVLNLIAGLARPAAGELRASDVPYDVLDIRALRRSIGIVAQHPSFFAGTVRENIAYGRPDATMDEIAAAARLALAHDFIALLPQGYDTEIGEGGALLSGGECQRLAIARALLGRPALLILDEPTNHLDRDAIERLMTGLLAWSERPTLLMISHDPTVVEFAETVYRLEQGALRAPAPSLGQPTAAAFDD